MDWRKQWFLAFCAGLVIGMFIGGFEIAFAHGVL